MDEYKDKYPDWFDEEGNYIPGSKENRIERIKDSIREADNAELYGKPTDIDIKSLKVELAELEGRAVDYHKQVNTLICEKYSLSEELSILRQRDNKPQEYQEYFGYCEKCKSEVKAKLKIE